MKKIAGMILMAMMVLAFAGPVFSQSTDPNSFFNGEQEIKFRDLPDSHWAAKSVYKLVKLGVTQGFPDGTFRGTRNMTRFEASVFLAKLADSLGSASVEKLGAELKSEIKSMQDELSSRNKFGTSGRVETNLLVANRTSLMNYRIVAAAEAEFNNSNSLKITLDTMDGGYYGGSEKLLTKLIDIEGVMTPDFGLPVSITATFGPGPQRHLFGANIIPSEYGRVYDRPYPGIKISGKVFSSNVDISYKAHDLASADASLPGEVGVSQFSGSLSWDYGKIAVINNGSVTLSADYFVQNASLSSPVLSNFKPAISFISNPRDNIKLTTQVKGGASKDITRSRMAVIQDVDIKNLFNMKANISMRAMVAGSEYLVEPVRLDEWTLLGYDPFGRPKSNGARSMSLVFDKKITDSLYLVGRGVIDLSVNYRYGAGETGSRLTYEAGFNVNFNKSSEMVLLYRVDTDPNAAEQTTNLLTLGFASKF